MPEYTVNTNSQKGKWKRGALWQFIRRYLTIIIIRYRNQWFGI